MFDFNRSFFRGMLVLALGSSPTLARAAPQRAAAAAPATRAPAAAAPAAKPHPDLSSFLIPTLPEPANGFGKALEDACAALKTNAVAASPITSLTRNRALEATDDAAKLTTAVSDLQAVCTAIDGATVEKAHLDALRGFQESGSFPALARGLAEKKSGAELLKAITGRPDEKQGPGTPTASLSGFESNLLNGLADFLVTRSKEEAILYLQDQLANEFCKEDGELVIPNTCRAIKGLDPSLSISAMGSLLNAAAKRDLVLLPDGVLKVLSQKDSANFGVYESLRLLYAVVLEVRGGRIPLEVARSVHRLPLRTCEGQPTLGDADFICQRSFLVHRAASALLYAGQANGIDQLARTLHEHPYIVLGTLIETEYLANAELRTVVTPEDPRLLLFAEKQMNLLLKSLGQGNVLAKTGEMLTNWRRDQAALTTADAKATPSDRKRLLASTLFDTITRVGTVAAELAPFVISDEQQRKTVMLSGKLLRSTAAIGRDVVNEDYAAVSLDVDELLTELDAVKKSEKLASMIATARRFVPLVTEIASAKSSADVSAALEAGAAPAGSYRAKYQRTKVTVNALVGALAGGEFPNDPQNDALGNGRPSGMVAGFAPVGMEVTAPFGSCFYGGVMLSVIDLGAMTTARFKQEASTDDETTTETEVTFAQVFSPGAYLMLGVGKSPFVLGGGVSFTPELRSLETENAAGDPVKEKVSTLRVGGFLAVDVSILSL